MRYKPLNIMLITFLISSLCFGQKKFSVSLHFPKEFGSQKVELSYDNGRIVKKVPFLLNNKAITISENFYSKFATILIQIDSNNLNLPEYNLFFVGEKPALITFHAKTNAKVKSLESLTLTNAYDVMKLGGKALDEYTAPEQQAITDLWSNPANADSIDNLNRVAVNKLVNKKLNFISRHKDKYYSFWLFRKEIAPNFFMNPDSLLHFYKTNFSVSLRNTLEGKEIMEILEGRKIAISENMPAPDFKITDIHGNRIELKNYKGKYVLINFWASWCVPCVGELPAIKKISDQYFPDKLEIITNTSDSDSSAFLNAIRKYGMTDWNNIYRDFDFTKKFGGVAAIPQLFLIDPYGKIIYNRSFNETDYEKLARLNLILKKRLQ